MISHDVHVSAQGGPQDGRGWQTRTMGWWSDAEGHAAAEITTNLPHHLYESRQSPDALIDDGSGEII